MCDDADTDTKPVDDDPANRPYPTPVAPVTAELTADEIEWGPELVPPDRPAA